MIEFILTNIELMLQTIVLVYIFLRSTALVRKSEQPVIPVLYCFGVLSYLVSNLYWIAHTLMYPGMRIPFTVNLMGENAIFLLFGAVLMTFFKKENLRPGIETPLTIVFTIAIVGLWIIWSGEWLKDILSGLIYAYYICICIRALRFSQAVSKKDLSYIAITAFAVICLQYAISVFDLSIDVYLEIILYILSYMVLILCIYKTISMIRSRSNDKALSLAFFCLLWSTNILYMSDRFYYLFTSFIVSFILIITYLAVRNAVEEL